LLVLAFFIYGIFNPSGAARLWYNVRTFPQRMAWWMWSTKEYLDYNTYKSKISSIWDNIWDSISDGIWDKINLGWNSEIEGLDFEDELDMDVDSYDDKKDSEVIESENIGDSSERQSIKAFPKFVKFIDIPQLDVEKKSGNKSDGSLPLTWYSKSDLIWVINKYIEKNLDDDTDILVTVEYEDDSSDPQKIILQTQKKTIWEKHSATVSWDLLDKIFSEVHWKDAENNDGVDDADEIEKFLDEDLVIDDSNNQVNNIDKSVKETISTKLTKEEKEEAEEILNFLF